MSDDLFSAAHAEPLLSVHGRSAPKLNVSQSRVFSELLNVSGDRPVAPADIGERLKAHIDAGTRNAVAAWPETTFFLGKSLHTSLGRCEGQVLADYKARDGAKTRTMPVPTAVGIVSHRAIQIAHTHADVAYTPEQLVRLALEGSCEEEGFLSFWQAAATHTQSDVLTRSVSATIGFLDTFPPLSTVWAPRFEESVSAKAGGVRLAARIDLVLGRPKADGRQTMFLADLKTSDIRDHHDEEAMFYALIAAMRHGIPPFRSTVISVASGEWTEPDVTSDRLFSTADDVVARVNAGIAVLTEQRAPDLMPSYACSWCPARATCSAADAAVLPAVPVAAPVAAPTLNGTNDGRVAADSHDDKDPFAIDD